LVPDDGVGLARHLVARARGRADLAERDLAPLDPQDQLVVQHPDGHGNVAADELLGEGQRRHRLQRQLAEIDGLAPDREVLLFKHPTRPVIDADHRAHLARQARGHRHLEGQGHLMPVGVEGHLAQHRAEASLGHDEGFGPRGASAMRCR